MSTGQFLNFPLPFKDASGQYISADTQSNHILTKANQLVKKGAFGVAITYSANYGQTRDIVAAYQAGKPTVSIGGSNQAAVMTEMEAHLNTTFTQLLGKMRVAPITTMNAYVNPLLPWNDSVLEGIIKDDLNRIEDWIKAGWVVLGWQNQDTVNDPTHPYAVGGGIAHLTPAQNKLIQDTLIGFAKQY